MSRSVSQYSHRSCSRGSKHMTRYWLSMTPTRSKWTISMTTYRFVNPTRQAPLPRQQRLRLRLDKWCKNNSILSNVSPMVQCLIFNASWLQQRRQATTHLYDYAIPVSPPTQFRHQALFQFRIKINGTALISSSNCVFYEEFWVEMKELATFLDRSTTTHKHDFSRTPSPTTTFMTYLQLYRDHCWVFSALGYPLANFFFVVWNSHVVVLSFKSFIDIFCRDFFWHFFVFALFFLLSLLMKPKFIHCGGPPSSWILVGLNIHTFSVNDALTEDSTYIFHVCWILFVHGIFCGLHHTFTRVSSIGQCWSFITHLLPLIKWWIL